MSDTPDKEYTVYFHGKISVAAQSESDATDKVYDELNDTGAQFTITSTDEGECVDCGGTGEVTVDAEVYPGEPHTAPIGTKKCLCQIKEQDHEPALD